MNIKIICIDATMNLRIPCKRQLVVLERVRKQLLKLILFMLVMHDMCVLERVRVCVYECTC